MWISCAGGWATRDVVAGWAVGNPNLNPNRSPNPNPNPNTVATVVTLSLTLTLIVIRFSVLNDTGFHPVWPPHGFGDPTSYQHFKHTITQMRGTCGAVRHGPESFNYYFPQDKPTHKKP